MNGPQGVHGLSLARAALRVLTGAGGGTPTQSALHARPARRGLFLFRGPSSVLVYVGTALDLAVVVALLLIDPTGTVSAIRFQQRQASGTPARARSREGLGSPSRRLARSRSRRVVPPSRSGQWLIG
ncbi:hypothetical protein [Streptomyces vinaceus]|uniref:hypothetical protein n=1 Tax=Streptomyces vinaceus TaxID=1960 RepID=UPI0036BEFDE0